MQTALVRWAAIQGFLAVALGAFGAHGLKERLTPDLLAIYQTGAQYHLTHALALLAVAALLGQREGKAARLIRLSAVLFLGGIVVFSGSLYLLALTGIRALGAITPIGGVCFLSGWALLAASTLVSSDPVQKDGSG